MRLAKTLYLLLAALVGVLILVKSLDYLSPDFTRGFLLDKQNIFPFYRFALYAHIIGTPLALFSGIYQFLFTRSRVHPFMGKIYVSSILLLAAPSGLVMSVYAIGGFISTVNFLLMSVLWFGFTMLAYRHIKSGNLSQHRQFMTRSFILTNSAILIRLFSFINNHYQLTDVTTGYILISWLSWLPVVLFYECHLFRKRRSGNNSNAG
ncbi:MAG: DUF2306 domain-containing protein [Roseivirga sp.]|nr:DUF2306 domain-containing protein [Roseivirga sp.]